MRLPTLTVCALTNDCGARFAATLALFKKIGADIVVAVDDRVPVADLDPVGAVADRLFRFEFATPIERQNSWLLSKCEGEWIFWIDSDEVPSVGLLDALESGLLRRRDVHQFPVPRRWLYPDRTRWIAESPWWPDFQFRIFRNDPATLWSPGTLHGGVHPVRPAQYLETPLYHLDFTLNSLERRRAKVETYRDWPTQDTAFPNSLFYLPEDHVTEAPATVPPADSRLIEEVCAAPPPRRRGRARVKGSAGRAEIDAHWDLRPMPAGSRRAGLDLLDVHARFGRGARTLLHVRVQNNGQDTWPGSPPRLPQVMVCYRWLTEGGEVVVDQGIQSPLTAALAPGASQVVPVTVDAPDREGRHRLQLDLLHDGIAWFGQPLELDVAL
ncbi:MAG: hypothetical protein QOK05_840 [Chloroflexota bacterium]|nr:hypothetical protein [Chloroflexota bacterium]